MDFNESSIQSEVRSLSRKFARERLAPHVEQDEEQERFRPEFVHEWGALGLAGIPTPENYSGAGLGYSEQCAALEEIAAVHAAYAVSLAVSGLPQAILAQSGTEAQKQKYIPPLADGSHIGAFALSEAGSGSDAGSLRTQAVLEGAHYRINGTKLWITQADEAQTLLLMARTGGPGVSGVSAFVLEKGMPGLRTGKREKKMGLSSSHTMEVVLENVLIPIENRVGPEGQGFKIAMEALNGGRITIGAIALGVARSALEAAKRHARERQQFGKSIGEFQGVGFMLADMATELEAARLLVYQAAWLKDQGKPYAHEASMAKLFATDAAMRITTDAVQILGGSGYTREFPVERYMREAKVLQIVEGTNQIQRLILSRKLIEEDV
jgi:butyryl-CoA dehydrogenase